MKNRIKQTWIKTFELLFEKPIILLPFVTIAFLEYLALEFIYFSPRRPLSYIVNPIAKKFFGENFVHYPGNFLLLPKLFYYLQIVVYIIGGVLLTAVAINIFKNIKDNLPIKIKAIVRNVIRRYGAFLTYGILIAILLVFLRKVDLFILTRFFRFAAQYIPNRIVQIMPVLTPIFLYFSNVIIQVFLILTIPIVVIQKKSFLKALLSSVSLGARNFISLFVLIFVPFLMYFPIFLLRSFPLKLVNITFPEMTFITAAMGIFVTIFVDCFIIICASQFLLNVTGGEPKK